jgi:hypothetical protein
MGGEGPRGGRTGSLLPLDTGFEELKLITLESELRLHVVLRGQFKMCMQVFKLYAFGTTSDNQTVSLQDHVFG